MLVDHLPKRTTSDKVLRDKTFDIANNLNYDVYQRRLASMAYNVFDKKSSGAAVTRSRLETLARQDKSAIKRELCQTNNIQKNHKIIRKFEKQKVYSF